MDINSAKVVSLYTSLIDHHVEKLHNYLSDDIALHWYGRTVRGKDLVMAFLSEEIAEPEHKVTSAKAIQEIQHRGSSYPVSVCKAELNDTNSTPVTTSADGEGLLDSCWESCSRSEDFPGPKQNESAIPQEDNHVLGMIKTPESNLTESHRKVLLEEPRKKKTVARRSLCFDEAHKFVEATGSVSFFRVGRHGRSSERQWLREFRLQIAYSCPIAIDSHNKPPYKFTLIIYSDEMRCRRNLCEVFDQISINEEKSEILDEESGCSEPQTSQDLKH